MHRVPEDAERRQTWLRRIGLPASEKRARLIVCGRHFSAEDYTRNPAVMQAMAFQAGRARLNPDAVPSLFLPTIPAHLDIKLHVAKATQTEPPPPQLPTDFRPPHQSTPVPSDEEMLVDEEDAPERPSDSSYHDEQAEEAPHEERKFLVFESNLRELLAFCRVCHKRCRNEFKVVGSMLHVTSSCPHHTETWQSQPLVGNKPAGNVLLAAAILFSGCTVATFLRALKSINVQTVHERTFFNYQRGYFLPAIKKLFQTRQDQLLKDLPEDGVEIAGDGRCDSPGYSAKYCTYTVLATEVGQILHYEQIRVGESPFVFSFGELTLSDERNPFLTESKRMLPVAPRTCWERSRRRLICRLKES
ncbi:hypothetical protein HPB52_018774 [Rhipicephalus sanguineus]|uniref:THAP-type domain-containing protein n=1 Tax=Rhipicephalus sanguineus TaxID=34632 RepID=A0A9D4SUW1_RHISA|nr:hypothetical protein HPB52_018774 [Rhipicephalus sanguineus]